MPRGDGSGPEGMGSMTGRGAGFCAGFNVPGFANRGPGARGFGSGFGRGAGFGRGMGYGLGFGRGMGMGRRFAGYYGDYPETAQNYSEALKSRAEFLEEELKAVKSRLSDLESEDGK